MLLEGPLLGTLPPGRLIAARGPDLAGLQRFKATGKSSFSCRAFTVWVPETRSWPLTRANTGSPATSHPMPRAHPRCRNAAGPGTTQFPAPTGLPESEAYYYIETAPREAGHYTFTLAEVPVDAFWSVTIYNRDGYLEPNPYDSFSINGVTVEAEPDGSVVLNLAPEGQGLTNHLYVMDGWNYALRLYRPHAEVVDKTWTPPTPQPAT